MESETHLRLMGGKPKQKKEGKKPQEGAEDSKDKKEHLPSKTSPLDFRDGSEILFDWTSKRRKGCIGRSVKQKDDICWAIVLARILQAYYNAKKLPLNQSIFSYVELVSQIKKGGERSTIGNIKKVLDFIATEGLMKMSETDLSGTKLTNTRISQAFLTAEKVSDDAISNLLEKCPIGVIIDLPDIQDLDKAQKDIYVVKPIKEPKTSHDVMITGHGRTKDGQRFFIFQNSWGEDWGERGFGRLAIDGGKWNIFYPDISVKPKWADDDEVEPSEADPNE